MNALEPLLQRTLRAVKTGEMTAVGLANVAYGASRSGKWGSSLMLFEALGKAAEWQLVNFMADGNGEFTKALGLEVDLSVALLAHRSKRFSMIIKNNSVVHLNNEDGPAKTEISDASTVISQISK